MTDGEQDSLAVPGWVKWLVEMRWPLICVAFFWAGEFVGYHLDRAPIGCICVTGEPIILPPGTIDADQWDQIVREHAAQGKCLNVIGAGRDETIVERR